MEARRIRTNPSTEFQDFSIKLSNGATLTGISYVPPAESRSTAKPLLVGIHGAGCSAHIWDASPDYTASIYSGLTGIPFVAFNRPNFLESSGWLVDRSSERQISPKWKAAEGTTYFQNEGRWFHEYIFPALWKEFALPNRCSSIVTTSHSMAVPITLLAAGLYSDEPIEKRTYVWAGCALTGFSEIPTQIGYDKSIAAQTDPHLEPHEYPPGWHAEIHIPPYPWADFKDLMLGPGPAYCCEAELRPVVVAQATPLLVGEITDLLSQWPTYKQKAKAAVKIPVLYSLGEYDWIWKGTKENVEAFCSGFPNVPRMEGAVVLGAPHAIEWSYMARGFWLRVFGWAIEVAVSDKMEKTKPPVWD